MREVLLHGNIGPGEITSDWFAQQLEALGPGPVTVGINSRGGNVVEGLGIYNRIAARNDITTRCDGVAASIASVIFCGGTKRVMPAASYLMVHRPYAAMEGNENQLREEADNLAKMTDTLLGAYCKACKRDKDEVLKALDDRRWFNATEASEWGFATEVVGSAAAVNLSAVLGDHFDNLPEPLRKQQTERKMELEKLQAELASTKTTLEKLQADLKTAAETIAARDAEIKTVRETQAKAFAKAAVDAGRIKAEVQDKWVEFHMANPANAEAMLPEAPKAKAGSTALPLGGTNEPTSAKEIVEKFNAMKPGAERSEFFAKHRALIIG